MNSVSERTAAQALRTNERLKALSGMILNLASALLATAFARWFVLGFDPYVFVWLAGALTGMAVGLKMLSYLEEEWSDG
jgi:hypothetical protein